MTKENLLRGKLGAMQMSITSFAKLMGISRPTAKRKIDGESQFTASEMKKACEILQIPTKEASVYFFNQ